MEENGIGFSFAFCCTYFVFTFCFRHFKKHIIVLLFSLMCFNYSIILEFLFNNR